MSKLNPWLYEKLRNVDPRIDVIVEADPGQLENVLYELRRMGLRPKGVAFNRFIRVTVPDAATLEAIERIPGVVEIHYDMPKWIKPVLPFSLSRRDPLLGEIVISKVEVPGPKPPSPVAPLGGLGLPRVKRSDVEIIPNSETYKVVVDVETSLTGGNVPVAVIDTGASPWHPQLLRKPVKLYTTVPEPPFDGQGHGMWCSTQVLGRWFKTRFGTVHGIAYNAKLIHIKALTTAGFGSSFSVLKAMEIALEAGAKVVSMSLGGPQQGPVDSDPECKAARILARHGVLVVVAAGNEGPGNWTIGSPGVCPDVLTVGAYSTLYGDVADFSSRGPSGEWYRDHPSDWQEDLAKYGDLLIKPDVIAPGGGPVGGRSPVDLIYSGVTGWIDGMYDLFADGYEALRGTSMATPHVAGLVALLAEALPEITVGDVKKVLAATAEEEKNEIAGWGLIKLSRFMG